MTYSRTVTRRQAIDAKRRTQKVRLLRFAVSLLLLLLAAIAAYLYSFYYTIKLTADRVYQPLDTSPTVRHNKMPILVNAKPITILLFGVDQRENDRGRSDTLLLAAVHPAKKTTLLVSIPRDTRTELVGRGTLDKINHAYAFGGTEMTINTVQAFLDISIDYYVSVNMEGFEQLIDVLGGIEVQNQTAYQYWGYQFPVGTIHLDGERALAYARMRYYDPAGDLGRNLRQQQVIKAILDKAKMSLVTNNHEILERIGASVKTNLHYEEWKEVIGRYRPAAENVETDQLRGSGKVIDGIYYYIVTPEERARVHDRFEAFLLEDTTERHWPLGGAVP
ncbi:LCP family protein [Brevibacillus humidisoli]|uniref:LCP family glycopolymer transferase n=1 Tax=Brevibacillus humidisoli TaxID=2895522 RepID=UPI001E5ED722|nr:LCP family protein [Brevibacillus humidisoli]UFJ42507.1 LCP family protein [Brevibacillus humidisoli]